MRLLSIIVVIKTTTTIVSWMIGNNELALAAIKHASALTRQVNQPLRWTTKCKDSKMLLFSLSNSTIYGQHVEWVPSNNLKLKSITYPNFSSIRKPFQDFWEEVACLSDSTSKLKISKHITDCRSSLANYCWQHVFTISVNILGDISIINFFGIINPIILSVSVVSHSVSHT